MLPAIYEQPGAGRVQFYELTVEQYQRMIADGILREGEPYELLRGQLVRKDRSTHGGNPMTIGEEHATVVRKLNRLQARLNAAACWIQTQLPVIVSTDSAPEPDGAIIRGREEDFDGRHPAATDVLGVIEVADSSLQHDRSVKMGIYADAAAPWYVIINLVDRVVEVYTQPMPGKGRYGRCETLDSTRTIELPATDGRSLMVNVLDLLP